MIIYLHAQVAALNYYMYIVYTYIIQITVLTFFFKLLMHSTYVSICFSANQAGVRDLLTFTSQCSHSMCSVLPSSRGSLNLIFSHDVFTGCDLN